MFNCRVCSNTPFGNFFGFGDGTSKNKSPKGKGGGNPSEFSSSAGHTSEFTEDVTEVSGIKPATAADRARYTPRSPEELLLTCRSWENYIHPRVKAFWGQNDERINQVLSEVIRGVDKRSDPLLGEETHCVFWHAKLSEEEKAPVIWTVKPGEVAESQMLVIRILVYFFCDDDSFKELQKKKSKQFEMLCGNDTCVNLHHVALD